MLATLLAQPAPTAEARLIMWRQVVDVLAQGRGHLADDPLVDAPRTTDAYNYLRSTRPEIPADLRIATAKGLAGRRIPPELILLFAEDLPYIAAPVVGQALLSREQWLAILPRLSPSARNLLRHRRDLGEDILQALEQFGSSDFLISGPRPSGESEIAPLVAPIPPGVVVVVALVDDMPASAVEPPKEPAERAVAETDEDEEPPLPLLMAVQPAGQSETQIRDLLLRIESYRARAPAMSEDAAFEPRLFDDEPGTDGEPIDSFKFETGIDGVLCWVQGAPRGPLIGETIAVAARQTDHGVDGHAAGAYRSRTPFRDARLTIAGDGAVSGEWRISAVPFFDARDGRFGGYRGTARRPRADETAKAVTVEPPRNSGAMPGEALRHLVEELRTPLSAIIDFSASVDDQRSAETASYQSRAREILEQSRKLLSAVEDLDLIAAARAGAIPEADAIVDAAALLMRLHGDFEGVARERASDLAFRIDPELPPVAVDSATMERMMSRLLAATIAMSSEGERISVDLHRDPRQPSRLLLTVVRPRALAGRDEKMLLDPGYNPDGNWPDAPVLGLGFALRLVRNLAIASGGMLEIDSARFYLCLPLQDGAAQAVTGNR
jgi:signal transduction histidine kinase